MRNQNVRPVYNVGNPAAFRQPIGEAKALTVTFASTVPAGAVITMNTTGAIVPLNLVQAGSSFFNRVGRKIEMSTVRLTLSIQPKQVARTTTGDYGRVMILYDRQTNGALPALADILQDTDQSGNNSTNSTSGINLNNRDRFLMIIDKRMYLPAVVNQASGVPSLEFPSTLGSEKHNMFIDEYRKLGNLVTHYKADSTPAVIGDIATGALYMVIVGSVAAGTEGWEIDDWNVRLRYKDI